VSIKKQFLKRKPVCKVTFRIPEEIGNSAKTAHVVGEFNKWDFSSTPMKKLKLKTGVFTATLDL
jgi:1,4-alpha-glucan branching enzyme